MNKKKKSIKFTWPKGKQVNGDIVFINGKNFAFIFLSIISSFINLVFISNLTKSGYAIGTILTIPGAILLGLMSIGLDVTKLLHSIQINSLNEIYRKVKNYSWSKKIKSAKIPALVVTMGGRGSVYANNLGESGICPAKKVHVNDTTGAGDAFCSGVAIGLTYGKTLADSVKIGTTLASSVIVSNENVCPRFLPAELGIDIDKTHE